MRRSRKVKILATLGPASSDEAMIRKAVRSGRRCVPHQYEPHRPRRRCARWSAASALSRSDSAGRSAFSPICRDRSCASASSPTARKTSIVGQTFTLDDNPEPGDSTRVHLPHPEILQSVEPGHRLLIDDGKLQLKAPTQPTASRSSARSSPAPRSPTRRASACPTPICRSAR